MNTNYLVYPCKILRLGEIFKKRNYIYCPCDEMIIVSVCSIGESEITTIWLQSTSKVIFADGSKDFFSMLVIHLNKSDSQGLFKGKIFSRGEKICLEGDEACTSNLLGFAFCKGELKDLTLTNELTQRLSNFENKVKAEDLFFIDSTFTKISVSPQTTFKFLNEQVEVTQAPKQKKFEVTASILNVREEPSKTRRNKNFSELSQSAKEQIVDLAGFKANGYVKGLVFTTTQIKGSWAKSPSGWVLLDYCKQI